MRKNKKEIRLKEFDEDRIRGIMDMITGQVINELIRNNLVHPLEAYAAVAALTLVQRYDASTSVDICGCEHCVAYNAQRVEIEEVANRIAEKMAEQKKQADTQKKAFMNGIGMPGFSDFPGFPPGGGDGDGGSGSVN